MKISAFRPAVLLVALLVLLSACGRGQVSGSMPDLTLTDLTGAPVELKAFKGQLVMLNLWATWCPPCRQEIPDFIRLQDYFGPKGLTIVGVSLDEDPPRKVAEFVRDNKINYPVLYAGNQHEALVDALGGIRGVPTTFLVGPDGRIIKTMTGVVPEMMWAQLIQENLPK